MSASLVQYSGKQTANYTNPSYTLAGVTAGNTILVLVNYRDDDANSTQASGVADGYGSYTQDKVQIGNNTGGNHSSSSVYSYFNAAAGSHTITLSRGGGSSAVYWVYEVLEIAGLPTTNSLDTSSATSYGSSTGPLTVTGGTLTSAYGFAVALCENPQATNEPSIPSPTGFVGLFGSADYPSGAAAYQVPTATTALTANFGTISADAWAVVLAYYQASSAATLPAATGYYTLSGEAATLQPYIPSALVLLGACGVYSLTGAPASSDYALTGSTGLYALAGQNALLGSIPILTASTGAYGYRGQNAELTLYVSGTDIVPNLVGMDYYNASYVLMVGGFFPTMPIQVLSRLYPPAYVISQSPAAYTAVAPNTAVTLTIVRGYVLAASFDQFNYQFGKFNS